MGQSTSSSEILNSDNQSHERLGVIKVFEASDMFNEQQCSYHLELKKSLQSEEKFQRWLSRLREIDTEQARDVLYLPLSFKFDKTAICGSSGQLILTFEYFPYVLKTEIRNRRKMAQYFQQSQLWYLLYNLVQAGTIFQKTGRKLGDFHPNNCLLNENGQFKIIPSCAIPDETTNYEKIVESPTGDAFLAPQQIDHTFLQKGIYPHVDQCRAEVYSIGMTLLQAATLQDCFYTYSRGPYKVNKKKLADLLKIVKDKYRSRFYDLLMNMLDEQGKRRKASSEIFAELYPYEEAILELREFAMNETSGKTVGGNSKAIVGENTSMNNNYSSQQQQQGHSDQFTYQKTSMPQQQNMPQQVSYGPSTNQYIGSSNGNVMRQQYPMNGTNQTIGNGQQVNQGQLPQQRNFVGSVGYSMTSIDNKVMRK